MDASNNNTLPQNSLLPDVNEWDHQQVDFQAIKPEQQLGSSYESPIRDYVPVSSPNDPVIKLDPQDEEEYAEMQRLSQSYTPEVQVGYRPKNALCQPAKSKVKGPLVGDLKSSKALAIEYANADPTYVRKTAVSYPPDR